MSFDPETFKKLTRSTDKQEIFECAKEIFAHFDKNENRALEYEEVRDLMHHMACAYAEKTGNECPSDDQIDTVARRGFEAMDLDGDNKITIAELCEYACQQQGI